MYLGALKESGYLCSVTGCKTTDSDVLNSASVGFALSQG